MVKFGGRVKAGEDQKEQSRLAAVLVVDVGSEEERVIVVDDGAEVDEGEAALEEGAMLDGEQKLTAPLLVSAAFEVVRIWLMLCRMAQPRPEPTGDPKCAFMSEKESSRNKKNMTLPVVWCE